MYFTLEGLQGPSECLRLGWAWFFDVGISAQCSGRNHMAPAITFRGTSYRDSFPSRTTMTEGTKPGESSTSGLSEPHAASSVSSEQAAPSQVGLPSTSTGDREDLLSKARAFLRSPQIQYQDVAAKRQFLAAKGVAEPDIEALLREQVRELWLGYTQS